MSAFPQRVHAHPPTAIIAGEKRNASSRFLQIFSHALSAVFASNFQPPHSFVKFRRGEHILWVRALLPSCVRTMGNLLLRMPAWPYQLSTHCVLAAPEILSRGNPLLMKCVLHRRRSLRRCQQGSPRATSPLCLPRQVISIHVH